MTNARILIVEDEVIAAKSLELRLTRLGYTVVGSVGFGEHAVSIAQTERTDLVLMDINLRGAMDGIQAADQIRAQLDIPVIFTTAHDDDETLHRAKITDPFGYLVKPFQTREIYTAIEMALYKHATDRKLRESEQRYRIISELVSDFAYSGRVHPDRTMTIEWITEAFQKTFGYSTAQLNTLDAILPAVYLDDQPLMQARDRDVFAGTARVDEYRVATPDGAVRWVRHYVRPIWSDAEQRVVHLYGGAQDVTERKNVEQALANERALFSTVIQNLPDLIYVKDTAGRYLLNNPAHLRSLGATRQEEALGKTAFHFFPEHQAARFSANEQHVIHTGKPVLDTEETAMDRRTESVRWHLTSKLPLHDGSGEIIGIVGISRDVTERKFAQDELAREKVMFEQLFENAPVGIVMLDEQDRVKRINAAFEHIFQFTFSQIAGKPINDLVVPLSHRVEAARFSRRILRGDTVHEESVRQRQDGTRVAVEIYGIPVLHKHKTIGLYAMYVDITERKRVEEQLQFASTHDTLTGIFNRAYFERELERLANGRQFPVSIVMVDIDRLKQTNDTLGHAAGDQLLRGAAEVLQSAFRADDIVARIGGDEFAVLLPGADDVATQRAVTRVRRALDQHNANHPNLPVSFSLGVATANPDNNLAHTIIEADTAMYQDKTTRHLQNNDELRVGDA
ncbi:MAG: PAS domain S-box protein [Chloroflexi bacterium]|nr:PAS domain S-box protein [Chloroflexota bacterium]